MMHTNCQISPATPTIPAVNELWRGKTFDAYVSIVDVDKRASTVTVVASDIGRYAHLQDPRQYSLPIWELQKYWRLFTV